MVGDTHTLTVRVTPVLTLSQISHSSKPSVITSIAVAGVVYGARKRSRRFGLETGGSTVRVVTRSGIPIAIHRGGTPGSTISRVIGGALVEGLAFVGERKLAILVVYCTAGRVRERGGEGGDREEEDMEDHTGVRDLLGLMVSTECRERSTGTNGEY